MIYYHHMLMSCQQSRGNKIDIRSRLCNYFLIRCGCNMVWQLDGDKLHKSISSLLKWGHLKQGCKFAIAMKSILFFK